MLGMIQFKPNRFIRDVANYIRFTSKSIKRIRVGCNCIKTATYSTGMKHFFDNVRNNNQVRESHEDEWDVLRADIAYLRKQCGDANETEEPAGVGFFAAEKTRLYKILHSI